MAKRREGMKNLFGAPEPQEAAQTEATERRFETLSLSVRPNIARRWRVMLASLGMKGPDALIAAMIVLERMDEPERAALLAEARKVKDAGIL